MYTKIHSSTCKLDKLHLYPVFICTIQIQTDNVSTVVSDGLFLQFEKSKSKSSYSVLTLSCIVVAIGTLCIVSRRYINPLAASARDMSE